MISIQLVCVGVFSRKAGQVSEGLACFWNTEKFRLVETERHVIFDTLDQFPNIHQAVEAKSKLKESLSKRTTVLKIVVLETAENLEPRSGLQTQFCSVGIMEKNL